MVVGSREHEKGFHTALLLPTSHLWCSAHVDGALLLILSKWSVWGVSQEGLGIYANLPSEPLGSINPLPIHTYKALPRMLS